MTPPTMTAALTEWPVPDALLQTRSERNCKSVHGGEETDDIAGVAEGDIVESGADVTPAVACLPNVCDADATFSFPPSSHTETTA
jgi:hypothetical protein